jgi:endoglucanase
MHRRSFLASLPCSASAALAGQPPQQAIPRWRGFNLLDLFQALPREPDARASFVREEECRWIRDWGFNFIRIPMDYWCWIDSDWKKTRTLRPDDAFQVNQAALEPVDRVVEYGQRYGLHVSLNLHRAPGYCINNPEREPFSLWSDPRAEEAFAFHWDMLAKRYKGVSEYTLSFNLLNEAPSPREGYMTRDDYARVMRRAANVIRAASPRRMVIIDGLSVGNQVVDEMIADGVVQSVHAYSPSGVSHYRAAWVDRKLDFPDPAWPLLNADGTVKYGRGNLERHYAPWGELARRGIGVHCGEAGCFNRTPHPVFLAWMKDVLDILTGHGIGYALWNFRGSFGMLDSGRADAVYQDWHGHKLDVRLLELMQQY